MWNDWMAGWLIKLLEYSSSYWVDWGRAPPKERLQRPQKFKEGSTWLENFGAVANWWHSTSYKMSDHKPSTFSQIHLDLGYKSFIMPVEILVLWVAGEFISCLKRKCSLNIKMLTESQTRPWFYRIRLMSRRT